MPNFAARAAPGGVTSAMGTRRGHVAMVIPPTPATNSHASEGRQRGEEKSSARPKQEIRITRAPAEAVRQRAKHRRKISCISAQLIENRPLIPAACAGHPQTAQISFGSTGITTPMAITSQQHHREDEREGGLQPLRRHGVAHTLCLRAFS